MAEEITTEDEWVHFWKVAGTLKATHAAIPVPANGIRGRWITVLYDRLCKFWNDHKETLIPVLSQFAVATLEALIAARSDVHHVNPPGPR